MIVIAILAAVVVLGAWVVLLVIAFRKHILWGLGSLLIPLVQIAFAITYWNETKKPFLIYLAANAIFIATLWSALQGQLGQMQGTQMELLAQMQQQLEQQEQLQNGETDDSPPQEALPLHVVPTAEERLGSQKEEAPQANHPQEHSPSEAAIKLERLRDREAMEKRLRRHLDGSAAGRNSFPFWEGKKYIGQIIRVTNRDGVVRKGRLKAVKSYSYIVEMGEYGASAEFEVKQRDIAKLEVVR